MNYFEHNVNLVPLNVANDTQNNFREALNAIPYLMYEVEQLADGRKILVNKPGGKRNFGRLSHHDFMVFIYAPADDSLWLISHGEIEEDIDAKYSVDTVAADNIMRGLLDVCNGIEPDAVIQNRNIVNIGGLPVDAIYKAYKWIWGQEDCNYPNNKGRWLSMDHLLSKYGIEV